jgi:hypothetical protein
VARELFVGQAAAFWKELLAAAGTRWGCLMPFTAVHAVGDAWSMSCRLLQRGACCEGSMASFIACMARGAGWMHHASCGLPCNCAGTSPNSALELIPVLHRLCWFTIRQQCRSLPRNGTAVRRCRCYAINNDACASSAHGPIAFPRIWSCLCVHSPHICTTSLYSCACAPGDSTRPPPAGA